MYEMRKITDLFVFDKLFVVSLNLTKKPMFGNVIFVRMRRLMAHPWLLVIVLMEYSEVRF